MSWFGARELDAQEEELVLKTAKESIKGNADFHKVDMRDVLSEALIKCCYVRDVGTGGKRVARLTRIVGSVMAPKLDADGVQKWAKTAPTAEVKEALQRAEADRRR